MNAPRLSEYAHVGEERSRVTVIETATHKTLGTECRLVMASPGWEPAGSVARWTDGFYAVWFTLDGARHGQRYALTDAGRDKARAHFDRIVTPTRSR